MNILDKIIANKKKEILELKKQRPLESFIDKLEKSDRDFKSAITCRNVINHISTALIAEIKRASPSEGIICKNFNHIKIAKIYEKYANAISVLTDKKFFQGSLEYLQDISKFSKIPLLRKDFIIDEYQIYESRLFGADAILLIADVLDLQQIERFINIAKSLNMYCLVEIHDEKELQKVLKIKNVEIIGINNRNLKTFKIDLKITIDMSSQWSVISEKSKRNIVFVSESGINDKKDIEKLSKYVDAFLIGTVLMKAKNIGSKISKLSSTKPLIKICGIQDFKTALFCEKNGVDFIGFNFVPISKRYIDPESAFKIVKKLNKIKKVGIFVNEDYEKVNQISEELNLDFVQLHGQEDLKYIKKLSKPVIKAFRVTDKFTFAELFQFKDSQIAYYLFDGPQNGIGFNHDLLNNLKLDKPFFIAGGINAQNVVKIINKFKPAGLDIASGVEINKQNTLKDFEKIKKIIKIIK